MWADIGAGTLFHEDKVILTGKYQISSGPSVESQVGIFEVTHQEP